MSKKFQNPRDKSGLRGHDRMVVGFTATCAISAYYRSCCDIETNSWRDVQHYVIKFDIDLFSDLRQ